MIVIFLETAELRAQKRTAITMDFWRENADRILAGNDMTVLDHTGSISRIEMEDRAETEYEAFNARRKKYEAELAAEQDIEELRQLEQTIKQERRDV